LTGPIREPRSGARGLPPRNGDPRPAETRTGGRRRPKVDGEVSRPWLERHAVRLRRATWIALAIIAVRLIAPRPDGWRRWSDAAAALADVEQARTAALLYYQGAARAWPAPSRLGVAPAGMLPFLPGNVSFARARYRLAWEYAADTTTGARVIGVSVLGDDPRLAQTMAARAPQGMPFVVSGHRFVALIASAAGR
jgi:hypothetical protein